MPLEPKTASRWSRPTSLAVAGTALALDALMERREARKAELRHPPIGSFIQVDGVRLHYLERGTGRPVVLMHGNGVTARDFLGCGLAETLSENYRVIALDRPGYGYSERPRWKVWSPRAQAELLETTLRQLGIERPVLVAHSWGTLVALALAAHGVDSLSGLVLISGYYFPTMRWDAIWKAPPAIPVIGDLMRYTISPLLGRITTPLEVHQMFAPDPVPAAFFREVRATADDGAAWAVARGGRGGGADDVRRPRLGRSLRETRPAGDVGGWRPGSDCQSPSPRGPASPAVASQPLTDHPGTGTHAALQRTRAAGGRG